MSISLSAVCAPSAPKIVYGVDDRLDLKDVTDERMLALAASTATMIPKWKRDVFLVPELIDALGELFVLEKTHNVCDFEPFADQPTIGECSGFLVDETTIVTAGHCINEETCATKQWVFDYAITSNETNLPLLKTDNIYNCAQVIKSIDDEKSKLDYAVVKLDRPVLDRQPLKFRTGGKIKRKTPLVVIGYPSGLPVKVAGGAKVLMQRKNYFGADLDTYGGNSGSAVINANTLEVEGILVRGDDDYLATPFGCRISNVIAKSKGSEHATRITKVKEIQPRRAKFTLAGLFSSP